MNSIVLRERNGIAVIGNEALARMLARYGFGQAQQAAIRAFGRIVDGPGLTESLLERLDLLSPDGRGEGAIGPALRLFCEDLACLPQWDFTPRWPERLVASWSECYLAGAVAEFPFVAIQQLVDLCQQRLFDEREMVYRLEMDIFSAVIRLCWCLGGLLSEVSIEREQAFRLYAEDGDPVLGIPNRRRFLALLDQQLAGPDPVGLVVIGVDWGRSEALLPMDERDGIRLAFTEALQGTVRPADILCALGEKEWAVILPGIHHPAQVSLAGHKMVDACEILRNNSFVSLNGRFAAGGALAPEHATDPLGLEQAARAALVAARHANGYFDLYSASLARASRADADMEDEVVRAFEACQFDLYLQPQICLTDAQVIGAEALLRWPRGEGVVVGPQRILAVLGNVGMIQALSRWVIQRAVQAVAALRAAGCQIRVSVNLSAEDLRDQELAVFVRQTCETWRVPAERLCFEITEGGFVADEVMTARTLESLRETGGWLSLDDFGTGYASMDYLRRMPVQELKLDKSFVERLNRDEADRAIVELMIRIAHTFGLEVVGEGVEDADTALILAALGCDHAQGYHYARPMPVDDFIDWWQTREGG